MTYQRAQKFQTDTPGPAAAFRRLTTNLSQNAFPPTNLTGNRNGLVVAGRLTQAAGTAEREAALEMIQEIRGNRRKTLGGDKKYDVRDFVDTVRSLKVTPHVAQHDTNRKSAIDPRTTRLPGYEVSLRKRKRVEEIFGWLKTVGVMRKTRHRGTQRAEWMFTFSLAAFNLVRMRHLAPAG